MKHLYYFGCIKDRGHYWFGPNCEQSSHARYIQSNHPEINRALISNIDGICPPVEYQPGYNVITIADMIVIVSWWDNTVDHRPGSSSTFMGINYKDANDVLFAAAKYFPSVMGRQPMPEKWLIK